MSSASPQEILQALLKELNQPVRSVQEMPRRVELCRRALALVNRLQQPELWGALQNTMGNSLAQNPQDNRAENLEQAIHHFQQALEVRTRAAFPVDWAMTRRLTNQLKVTIPELKELRSLPRLECQTDFFPGIPIHNLPFDENPHFFWPGRILN
jgi:hypothetical protein